jgi:surfactin synthase thioesterase subunit
MRTPQALAVWLPWRRPNPQARLRVFAFPYAGGGASAYRGWSEALPPDVELCAIQLPGREARLLEPALSQLPALVETLESVLAPLLDRPCILLGYSMGTRIALALAQRWRDRGLVLGLVAAAAGAPHLPRPSRAALDDAAFLEVLRRYEGTPAEVFANQELMELVLPLLRADFSLADTVLPAEPVRCPLAIWSGLEDSHVSPATLERWSELTTGDVLHRRFPGKHFFLRSARDQVLQALREEIARWAPGPRG